jgi:hypothetical protein
MRLPEVLKGVELVRMSNGDYCLVRPLGLVPGGKGMKYQENLLRLTPSGVASKLWLLSKLGIRALKAAELSADLSSQQPSTVRVKISQQPSRASAHD